MKKTFLISIACGITVAIFTGCANKADSIEKKAYKDLKEIEETYETKEPQSLSQISEKEIKGSVISGLLNVDVLKEVLDGMEMQITIKFKNKKKKKWKVR